MQPPRHRFTALTFLVAALLLVAPGSALAGPLTTGSAGAAAVASSTSSTSTSGSAGSVATKAAAPRASTQAVAPKCSTNADALYPVICLPAGFGENEASPIEPGEGAFFAVQLVNNGVALPDAQFTIDYPRTLIGDPEVTRIDDFFVEPHGNQPPKVRDLDCTASNARHTITCRTGALAHGTNALLAFDFDVDSGAAQGTTATFTSTLRPLAPATFLSTSVRGTVRVLQTADLHVSLSRKTISVAVGARGAITARFHNVGKGAATDTLAVAIATRKHQRRPSHFVITNGSSLKSISDGSGGGGFSGGSSESAGPAPVVVAGRAPLTKGVFVDDGSYTSQRRSLQRVLVSRRGPSIRLWPLHTIAAGATRTLTIRVEATSVGIDRLAVLGFSDNDSETDDNGGFATAKLIATAPHAAAGSGARLANSGPLWLGPLLAGGLLALLAGCALLIGVRRPGAAGTLATAPGTARHRH